MEEEIWKPVPSAPRMRASSWGRARLDPIVYDLPNGGMKQTSPIATYGYASETTGLAGFRMIYRTKHKTYKVARLVCEAFHGPPFDRAVAMHLDDDPANNRPENLKWGTVKENLNTPQFLNYCRSRTGDSNPFVKGRKKKDGHEKR
jgi:hypothetical protein